MASVSMCMCSPTFYIIWCRQNAPWSTGQVQICKFTLAIGQVPKVGGERTRELKAFGH